MAHQSARPPLAVEERLLAKIRVARNAASGIAVKKLLCASPAAGFSAQKVVLWYGMVRRVRFTQKGQDDITFVACHRVADLRSPHVPSMIVSCSKCQAPIWRAENSPTKPPAMCIQCIRQTVTSVGSNTQLDELLNAAVKRTR